MSKLLLLGSLVITLVIVGCACLFETAMLVEWIRKDYLRSSKAIQNWGSWSTVMKPWFPIYLRMMGIFFLLFAILVAGDFYQLLQQQ